jgi:hypothetical protein
VALVNVVSTITATDVDVTGLREVYKSIYGGAIKKSPLKAAVP